MGIFIFIAFLFSCRDIPVSTFTHNGEHPADEERVGCCDSTGEKAITDSIHHDLIWSTAAYRNVVDFLSSIKLLLAGIGILLVSLIHQNCRLYIRAIRDRYGSFSSLNYFTGLFSQGILHAKVF